MSQTEPRSVDLVTYEVIRNRLNAISAQQSLVLKNVSGSPLVTDANDCNTGIYLPSGDIVTMGPHIIFHSGSMEIVVSNIVSEPNQVDGIREGDVFITNDPYKGALHMPDVTMVEPVFHEGTIVAWVGSCAHVLDIGGMTPSSWSPAAREVQQEGLILPPTKLVSDGKIRRDVWNLIMAASRLPASLGLDLKAMIASNGHARDGLLRLIARYGVEVVNAVMREMLDRSEMLVRERLRTLPDGTFRARNYFDHDGHTDVIARVELEMTKKNDELIFDYERTSPQTQGFMNCTEAGLRGGVFAAVLPVIAYDIPWNSGVMRAITVSAPRGSLVNAQHPAPCGSATVGGAYMVQDTAGVAISQLVSADDALRSEAMAVSCGSLSVLHIGGLNQFHEPFGGAVTEMLAGGGGATLNHSGNDYQGPHEILAYQITNVEGDEAIFPLLWLNRGLSIDGGGAGRHHGGASLSSAFTLHDAHFLHMVCAGHGFSMPSSAGLHGGMPGSTHNFTVLRGTDVHETLASGVIPASATDLTGHPQVFTGVPGEVILGPGDVLDWSFHGGGGWGDPLDADPEFIALEVRNGRISVENAARAYGVIISANAVVGPETEQARMSIRDARRRWSKQNSAEVTHAVLDGSERRLGEHLVQTTEAFACDCGTKLAPLGTNWKEYALRGELQASDLGPKIRLHREFTAEAFACPRCACLLGVEIRWIEDEPLFEVDLAH